MSNCGCNRAFLTTMQCFTKILEFIICIVVALLLCHNWSPLPTCFRDPLLGVAAALATLALFINLLSFAGNLLGNVSSKIEFGASICCAFLMLLQIFAITKFLMSSNAAINNVHLVAAMVASALAMSIFVYTALFALLLTRLNDRRKQRPPVAVKSVVQRAGASAASKSMVGGGNGSLQSAAVAVTPDRSREEHRIMTAASPAVTGNAKTVKSTAVLKLYEAANFQFKGSLKIPKKNQCEMTPLLDEAHEKDDMPKDAPIRFTDTNNLIYDIGSEVEQLID